MSNRSPPVPMPGTYQSRPLLQPHEQRGHPPVGAVADGRAGHRGRAVDQAVLVAGSRKNDGMNGRRGGHRDVALHGDTAGTPASASRGPSAASTPASALRRSAPRPALWQDARTTSRGGREAPAARSTSSLPSMGAALPSSSSSSSTGSSLAQVAVAHQVEHVDAAAQPASIRCGRGRCRAAPGSVGRGPCPPGPARARVSSSSASHGRQGTPRRDRAEVRRARRPRRARAGRRAAGRSRAASRGCRGSARRGRSRSSAAWSRPRVAQRLPPQPVQRARGAADDQPHPQPDTLALRGRDGGPERVADATPEQSAAQLRRPYSSSSSWSRAAGSMLASRGPSASRRFSTSEPGSWNRSSTA